MSINQIDKKFDDQAGKSSFLQAIGVSLNERGATWLEALGVFKEGTSDFLGPARDVLFNPLPTRFLADDKVDQIRVDMLAAYYEGMFLSPLNEQSVQTLVSQVHREMEKSE